MLFTAWLEISRSLAHLPIWHTYSLDGSSEVFVLDVPYDYTTQDFKCYWDHRGSGSHPDSLLNITNLTVVREVLELMNVGQKYWISDISESVYSKNYLYCISFICYNKHQKERFYLKIYLWTWIYVCLLLNQLYADQYLLIISSFGPWWRVLLFAPMHNPPFLYKMNILITLI